MPNKINELFIYSFLSNLLSFGTIFNKGVIKRACIILLLISKIAQAIENIPNFSKPKILEIRIILMKLDALKRNWLLIVLKSVRFLFPIAEKLFN